MELTSTLRLAFSGLKSKKTRTFLTMLGIIIGISSVIIIISVGAGAQSLILNQIKALGSNQISIFPGASEESGPPPSVFGSANTSLKIEDLDALNNKQNVPHVVAITYYVRGTATMKWQDSEFNGTFVATTASYPEVHDIAVAQGRFLDQDEEKNLAKVVVLGANVKDELFGDEEAIGQLIKIKKHEFRVIGVMAKKGTTGFENQDNYVFIPVSTGQKIMLGIDYISLARVKIDSQENVNQAVADIKAVLRDRHNLDSKELDDFTVRAQAQAIEIFSSITNSLTYFLAAIAAISLLVGGIGIMNIMLIAVTERTREIGLRKALGAKRKNILSQFLIESIAVTLLGGIIGIIFGIVISLLVAFIARYLGYNWDFVISISAVFLSCTISIMVGLFFGLYPAFKASELNPIEALQYE
ncbi:MAG: ABC transporter permease [Candidatus Parcubacteria bacterium]|nr:ABC transporter permease [Candidatus Parcubacteria bacterium]